MVNISEGEIARVVKHITDRPRGYSPIDFVPTYVARDSDGWWAVFDTKPRISTLGSYLPVSLGGTKILVIQHTTYNNPCCIPITKE